MQNGSLDSVEAGCPLNEAGVHGVGEFYSVVGTAVQDFIENPMVNTSPTLVFPSP